MTQFHEGQEVEVARMTSAGRNGKTFAWRKAKIVRRTMQYIGCSRREDSESWLVQFLDSTSAVFDAEHIRAIDSPERTAAKKVAHEFGEKLMGRGSP